MRRSLLQLEGETVELNIANTRLAIAGGTAQATTINGGVPGPEIRLREGQDATILVHNSMDVDTSIHWHGILIPTNMDGVPGISFAGIKPGETFEYRFPIRQSGTYWYHSHSGLQDQTGLFGALIIDPKEPGQHSYDREYTIMLSDWTFERPERVLSNLKRYGGYYNFQRRTLANLPDESRRMGFRRAMKSRMSWNQMRMDSTDISDVTGVTYTYLVNGLSPDEKLARTFSFGGTHSIAIYQFIGGDVF
ncbi:MAG: multicopper oxidase domain-containing protein [Polyangiales bacterium]